MNAFIVVGLGYGDEGKGSWVDYLVREHDIGYVVRFNGGSQAAHNVVSPEGVVHCFSQFGSGTLVPGTKTLLSHYMLVNPLSVIEEARVLSEKGIYDALDRLIIDRNCPVMTPFNAFLNRIQEVSRGDAKHSSCGCGIGLTQKDVEELGENAIYIRDLEDSRICCAKFSYLLDLKLERAKEIVTSDGKTFLKELKNINLDLIMEIYSQFGKKVQIVDTADILDIIKENSVVFEGAQGVLLDQNHGFYPYVTRSNTTFENAMNLVQESLFDGEIIRIGLLRGYSTRHGAGPFVTEDSELKLKPCHNRTNQWQGDFHLGWFDCVNARYALEVCGGVDVFAITNLDRMSGLNHVKLCNSYHLDRGNFRGIKSIRSVEDGNLSDSEIRTSLLKRCKPKYLEVSGWQDCDDVKNLEYYLRTIGFFVGQKVGAISLSPTAQGKSEKIACLV